MNPIYKHPATWGVRLKLLSGEAENANIRLASSRHQWSRLVSIVCKHALQLDRVEGRGLRASRITRKYPENLGRQKEASARNAGLHFAHAKCRQHRATGRDVFLHAGLECFRNAMNFMRRRKFEAVGKFFVCREVPGPGLIHEGLMETLFQSVLPLKSPLPGISSPTTSPDVVTISWNTRLR